VPAPRLLRAPSRSAPARGDAPASVPPPRGASRQALDRGGGRSRAPTEPRPQPPRAGLARHAPPPVRERTQPARLRRRAPRGARCPFLPSWAVFSPPRHFALDPPAANRADGGDCGGDGDGIRAP